MAKKNCSERIKEAMELRNMKQVELSEQTGIKKSALSQYISGKILPRQNNVYKLAKALNVNEAWLMGYEVSIERTPDSKRILDLSSRERLQYEDLMQQNAMFFNDENISEEDKAKLLEAMQEAFFTVKLLNKRKK